MSGTLKHSIRLGIASVLSAGAQLLSWNTSRKRILMYHRVRSAGHGDPLCVDPAAFAEQIAWLAEHSDLVTLDELHRSGGKDQSRVQVAVTFDDGYLDNLTEALPVLERHGVPATLFVTTSFCDQSQTHPRYREERGQVHMNWKDVQEWNSVDGYDVGSHTLTHPMLPLISDEQSEKEITDSRKQLQDQLGASIDYFAYPNGAYVPRDVALCRGAGYAGAVTTHPGPVSPDADAFEFKRTEMNDKDGVAETRLKLAGGFDLPHRFLDWRRQRALKARMS